MASGLLGFAVTRERGHTPLGNDPRIDQLEARVSQLQGTLIAQQMAQEAFRQGDDPRRLADAASTEPDPPSLENEGPADGDGVGSPLEEGRGLSFTERDMAPERIAYENQFRGGGSTPWATGKEDELRRELSRSSLARVRRIECRGSMCRVETEHESTAEAEAFLDENDLRPGLLGTTYHRYPLNDTGTEVVMFVEPSQSAH
jgi:hypothetical protein